MGLQWAVIFVLGGLIRHVFDSFDVRKSLCSASILSYFYIIVYMQFNLLTSVLRPFEAIRSCAALSVGLVLLAT